MPWKRIWKTWAPLRCKIFIWLAVKNRCWTADRLAKRGLPHPAVCPHCDQAEESIQHLLVSCVCAHHVWTVVLQKLGFILRAPQANTSSFSSWWCQAIKTLPNELTKGLNSLIILVVWKMWKHDMTMFLMA